MSLLYFGLLGLHIAAGALIALALVRLARRHGKSGWKFSVPIIVGSYLLVFWDVVPTAVVHTYLCRTQAGVTVYKDANAWVAEHPEEAKEVRSLLDPLSNTGDDRDGYWINDRFYIERTVRRILGIPVRVTTEVIKDGRTGASLVERRQVTSGYVGERGSGLTISEIKGWVGLDRCAKDLDTFTAQLNQYNNMNDVRK